MSYVSGISSDEFLFSLNSSHQQNQLKNHINDLIFLVDKTHLILFMVSFFDVTIAAVIPHFIHVIVSI